MVIISKVNQRQRVKLWSALEKTSSSMWPCWSCFDTITFNFSRQESLLLPSITEQCFTDDQSLGFSPSPTDKVVISGNCGNRRRRQTLMATFRSLLSASNKTSPRSLLIAAPFLTQCHYSPLWIFSQECSHQILLFSYKNKNLIDLQPVPQKGIH